MKCRFVESSISRNYDDSNQIYFMYPWSLVSLGCRLLRASLFLSWRPFLAIPSACSTIETKKKKIEGCEQSNSDVRKIQRPLCSLVASYTILIQFFSFLFLFKFQNDSTRCISMDRSRLPCWHSWNGLLPFLAQWKLSPGYIESWELKRYFSGGILCLMVPATKEW